MLRRSAWLSLGTVALVSLSQAPTALADDGDHDEDDKHRPTPIARLEAFSSDLVTVSQSASSGDFTSGNPGSDPLVDGRVTLRRRGSSGEGRAAIALRGTTPDVSFEVFFQPFASGKARESLGTIGPTSDSGHLNAQTPNVLSGSSRVGIFILVRTADGSAQASKDQFVSSLGG